MFYVFTALFAEAKPLIHHFHLKSMPMNIGFPVFENPEHELRLIITGIGSIAAAAAVGSSLAYFGATKYDTLINWGGCAGNSPIGSVFLCSKILEHATGHTFYPDLLIRHSLSEAVLITEPHIVYDCEFLSASDTDQTIKYTNALGSLHDMEAAGIYQAGSFFLPPHQMHFLKVVSDHGVRLAPNTSYDEGETSLPSTKDLEKIMKQALPLFLEYLTEVKNQNEKNTLDSIREDIPGKVSLEQLARDFCCSQTMKSSLKQHLHYWKLAGYDYEGMLRRMYERGDLPCQNKRQGKFLFEQLKKDLLFSDWYAAPSLSTEPEATTKDLLSSDRQATLSLSAEPETVTEDLSFSDCHIAPSLSESSKTNAVPSRQSQKNTSFYSHIYVEKDIQAHPRVQKILHAFPHARIIPIEHYKDVFCRKKQDVALQGNHPALILAAKRGTLLYAGAPVCQSFGNEHFYYTSCMMNCLYNCEYCYLKGMYPSGNIVIFVNLEDFFTEASRILQKHDVYLCVSYDTDLMALENLTGFVRAWAEFAGGNAPLPSALPYLDSNSDLTGFADENAPLSSALPYLDSGSNAIKFTGQNAPQSSYPYSLKIEVRTKCGRIDLWEQLPVQENVIFAFTLSPQEIISLYEHRTASLADRIRCAKAALEHGFPVRLCFDPILYHPRWKSWYSAMLAQVTELLPLEQLYDVSVGSFRISKDYLKKLRHVMKESAIVQFPFENENGVYHYPTALMEEMEEYVVKELRKYIPSEKIFRW